MELDGSLAGLLKGSMMSAAQITCSQKKIAAKRTEIIFKDIFSLIDPGIFSFYQKDVCNETGIKKTGLPIDTPLYAVYEYFGSPATRRFLSKPQETTFGMAPVALCPYLTIGLPLSHL